MMVVIHTDLRWALTAPSMTRMPSLSEILFVNFISSLYCALSLIYNWLDDIRVINC
jgi:hypothetical protein